MGYIDFSMPREIVLKFAAKGGIVNFVETGTYKGNTSYWAAAHFEHVFTIEIDPEISRTTASRPDCPKNIRFLVGNSKDVLPEIVGQIQGRSIFWLDGHWCNVTEMGKDMECPLMEELISLRSIPDAVILIDDARAFLGPLPPPHDNKQWPRIDDIVLLLKKQFPQNLVTIADDVIYCLPPDMIGIFDEDWIRKFQRRFESRQGYLQKLWKRMVG